MFVSGIIMVHLLKIYHRPWLHVCLCVSLCSRVCRLKRFFSDQLLHLLQQFRPYVHTIFLGSTSVTAQAAARPPRPRSIEYA